MKSRRTPSRKRVTHTGHTVASLDPFRTDGMEAVVLRLTIASVPSLFLRQTAFLAECGFGTGEIARILKRSPSSISHAKARLERILETPP